MKNVIKKGTKLKINSSSEGETIELKIQRIVSNKEPISDAAPLTYTDRRDGVQPGFDIRTDRFEIAIEAMDKVTKSTLTKREEYYKKPTETKPEETTGETKTE